MQSQVASPRAMKPSSSVLPPYAVSFALERNEKKET